MSNLAIDANEKAANDDFTLLLVKPVKTIPDGGLPQNKLAQQIAEAVSDDVLFDPDEKRWFMKSGYIWQPQDELLVKKHIADVLGKARGDQGFTESVLKAIFTLVRGELLMSDWVTDRYLLPMKNGVLNLKTKKLEAYQGKYFTWQLPYDFDKSATCPTIKRYLVTATDGDKDLIRFLLAWLLAVLHGWYELQKYLELIGPGGTGKSTFLNLCTMLVGKQNQFTTTLKQMEKNQFETANYKHKRLVLVTDSEAYHGDVSTLKAMTGGDKLRFEMKGKQATLPFTYTGMVTIAANEPIGSKDYSSGLARRRISIQFNQRVTEDEKQRYPDGLEKAFANELPGLINWLLTLDQQEAISIIKSPEGSVKSQSLANEVITNPILGWLDDCVIWVDDWKQGSHVGKASENQGSFNIPMPQKLYPSYQKWCSDNGKNPKALNNFARLVVDACISKGMNVEHQKGKYLAKGGQGAIITHLRVRTFDDRGIPSLILKHAPDVKPNSEEMDII